MTARINVTKRNGSQEPIDYEKINRVLEWGCDGVEGVSASQVAMRSDIQFFDGIASSDIHKILIKTAADMISEETPNYDIVAARLSVFGLRKQAYGSYTAPHLYSHASNMYERGLYCGEMFNAYTPEDYETLNSIIQHDRDLNIRYAGIKQYEGKYLVQDRVTGQMYETPQMALMFIAMTLFQKYEPSRRLGFVARFYNAVSVSKLSLPTPIMSGARTPTRQYSSCVLIECDDTLNSINASASAIVNYISMRAGIGINAGRIRGLGSKIRGGEAFHTGVLPFYKYFQTAVKSCSQGGVRGGAATLFYPIWHSEFESLIVLKNNRGVEENRIRQLDYGVQINGYMYKRLTKNIPISLFSPNDVPGLYDAFFADQDEFARLYEIYEADHSIKRKVIPALDIFSSIGGERASTGRIYIQNVDHCNTNSPFDPTVAPIRQSNLCLEIALPTKPLVGGYGKDRDDGEIALCTLAAFNLGEMHDDSDIEECAELAVRALDEILDFQDYPHPAALHAKGRRALGIGVVNYAYYLAKHGFNYSSENGNQLTHELFESIQYYCLKASNKLAAEKGVCDYYHETSYSKGVMPIDRYYKKTLDTFADFPLKQDWETLRELIRIYGLRNSTLTALMPSETSSQISNATNGIEPPRGAVSVKASKDGILKQVVPDIGKVEYEFLWNIPDNTGYLQKCGIMQKFIDQAISANTNYDPSKFENRRVPMKVILRDLLTAYQYGLKTLYYHNTRDGNEEMQDEGCSSGACKI